MSNYLAIATVTATLQRMLQAAVQLDVPGASVTTTRPDASSGNMPEVGVNVYFYHAAPNPAWRNADLRTRRPKGDLIKQAQAGLDLHYLLTFYGNDVDLEPQRLLGSAVRTLADQPTLTAEMINETINHPGLSFLQTSTLADQIERVAIVPSFLSTDDLSKIWSVFFQTPYVLSFACQGSAVLIEGDKPSGRGLPIRSLQFYATPTQPVIQRVFVDAIGNQPLIAESRLVIRGQQLEAEVSVEQLQAEAQRLEHQRSTQSLPDLAASNVLRRSTPTVQLGNARVTPHTITATEIRLQLAQLPEAEKQQLRACVQSLQLLYPLVRSLADLTDGANAGLVRTVRSNTVPIVLCPTIADSDIRVTAIERDGDQIVTAELTIDSNFIVGVGQRVFLLLNQRVSEKPSSYIFTAQKRSTETRTLTFTIRDIKAGDYLVRLEVDGAESPLVVEGDRYVSPRVDIQ